MNILVTGGAGYIGSHMVRCLLKNKLRPVVLDSLICGHKEALPSDIKFYQGDIADHKLVSQIIKTEKITAVMHFSAFINVSESVENPYKYYENNFVKTLSLLNSLRENSVEYFIFSSTAAVYGTHSVPKLTEQLELKPINPYGWSKLMTEQALKDFSTVGALKYAALRYFNAAGADENGTIGEAHHPETHLIPLALQSILQPKRQLKVFGTDYSTPDGTCVRDYIHICDLAEAHLKALEYIMKNKTSDYFNLGSENGYSVKEIIQTCEKVSGQKVNYQETERRAGDPAYLVADSSKARQILGWQTTYDLEKIIATAWQWEQNRRY